jgi:hypothetical protein
MKRGDVFPSKWLKASDIEDDTTVTISNVVKEDMPDDESEKSVVYFRELEKGLILNITNWNVIEALTGEEDSDNWEGHQITLFTTEVDFKGKQVEAIRIRTKPKKGGKTNGKKHEPADNGSTHGKGQYAPPEQQEHYKTALTKFLRDLNAAFIDMHTDKDTGEIAEGVPNEVVNLFQMDGHLAKHCKETKLLPNVVIPEGGIKNRQIGAYTAIVYFRSGEDRTKLVAEAKRYFAQKADAVTAAIEAGRPGVVVDDEPFDESAKPIGTKVAGGFDEFA